MHQWYIYAWIGPLILIGEGDGAVDLVAALLAVGWGAAELGSDIIGAWDVGVLVSGLEWTQGIDVLITGGTISPAHIPPVKWE